MLISAFVFSQSSQQAATPIKYDQKDGVFITIETMDAISLKLIDRQILKKENKTLAEVVENSKAQINELNLKWDLSESKANDFKNLYTIAETQKNKALENYESQVIITKNVKKKHLKTVFYISEAESRSVWSPLLC